MGGRDWKSESSGEDMGCRAVTNWCRDRKRSSVDTDSIALNCHSPPLLRRPGPVMARVSRRQEIDRNSLLDKPADSHPPLAFAQNLRRGFSIAAIELEGVCFVIGDDDLHRRGDAALVDLHAENVLRCKRAVVNPAVAVAVQVEDGGSGG